jgi:hypothetical protein
MPIQTHLAVIVVLVACTSPPSPSPPAASPSSPAPSSAPSCEPPCRAGPSKVQSPDVKLALGHFANRRRGIGLVFDRTTAQAKLRFDGTAEIIQIDPQGAGIDRVDYIRSLGHVVLQQWNDGRVVVFVGGVGIDVVRDGDADPL